MRINKAKKQRQMRRRQGGYTLHEVLQAFIGLLMLVIIIHFVAKYW